MTMLLEQHPSAVRRGLPLRRERDRTRVVSRRSLVWAHTDLFAQTEVSAARRLAAWMALAVCFAVLILLVLGV